MKGLEMRNIDERRTENVYSQEMENLKCDVCEMRDKETCWAIHRCTYRKWTFPISE